MSEEKKSVIELVQEFVTKWPLSIVENMSIDDYIDKGGFYFDLDNGIAKGLGALGKTFNSQPIYKGIYKKNDRPIANNQGLDDKYKWYKQYGNTSSEAFKVIKDYICKIISIVQDQNKTVVDIISEIDTIRFGGNQLKWKIAYIYSNNRLYMVYSNKKLKEAVDKVGLKFNRVANSNGKYYIKLLEYKEKYYSDTSMNDFSGLIYSNKLVEIEETQNNNDNEDKQPDFPRNLILFGPPGTGKTFNTKNKALEILFSGSLDKLEFDLQDRTMVNDLFDELLLTEEETEEFDDESSNLDQDLTLENFSTKLGRIIFTTFHQSMTYEDFIEGIKPIKPDEKDTYLKYEIQDGIFKKICELARVNNVKNYVLIIDEINRGNIAQIFGELITLIEQDKREGEDEVISVTLPYSKDSFSVPNNLYIIGTMNTADRSVEALDTALRRRFTFKELMPIYRDKEEKLSYEVHYHKIGDILYTINKRIEVLLDREHQIGHSYFLKVTDEHILLDVLYNNIIPLLQEFFYNDYEKIALVLGDGFIESDKKIIQFPNTSISQKTESAETNQKVTHRIIDKDKIRKNLNDALNKMNIQKYPVSNE